MPKLNGMNYDDWSQYVKLFLAISNMDDALTEDKPTKSTDQSSAIVKEKYYK